MSNTAGRAMRGYKQHMGGGRYGGDGAPAPVEIVPAADVARAAAALADSVAAGLDVGMVGIKHVFAALAATGHGSTALAALTSPAYCKPSVSCRFCVVDK